MSEQVVDLVAGAREFSAAAIAGVTPESVSTLGRW